MPETRDPGCDPKWGRTYRISMLARFSDGILVSIWLSDAITVCLGSAAIQFQRIAE
jgi:hypothetical protein